MLSFEVLPPSSLSLESEPQVDDLVDEISILIRTNMDFYTQDGLRLEPDITSYEVKGTV